MVVCLYYTYYPKIYNKAPIYYNELLLPPSSPFDIKCKKNNLMRKTSGNVFLENLGGCVFHIFQSLHPIMGWGGVRPNTFKNFCGSCYNIQFKFYGTSKIEFFVTKNRYWLETVVDCCYKERRVKCDRAPRSDSEMHR